MYNSFGKRLFDIIVSVLMLLLLSPLFIVLALITWGDVGHPIFIKQRRLGLHGQEFTMFKFKTLSGIVHHNHILSLDEMKERTSLMTRWLRLHACDELPQLLNVLLGHMSLVGPRPLQDADHKRHHTPSAVLQKILSVRPGITGAGQIAMSKKEYQNSWTPVYDLRYAEEVSFLADLIIMVKTIPVVIRGH